MERKWKRKSRKLAREMFWEKHDRETYECPDCGRQEEELLNTFEVHHKDGQPMDNRPENHVALCRPCHNLREGKKPSIGEIRNLRSQSSDDSNEGDDSKVRSPSVYLAGSMDNDSAEHDTWRASVAEYGDRGTYKYTGSTPIQINSPTEVSTSHGCGIVKDIAGEDMELVDQSDAIVAYFDKEEQVGTLTELVYAVGQGKPALVLFDRDLVPYGSPSDGVTSSSPLTARLPTALHR
ncbi:nucleoside 2-deoxyribosyltransferase domain-containing protein [Halorubrum amylolyticum]|uniref:nucleoside 2-deoxyribosyltransferase domain-containing protein n=1 Tax=Halorubrum amylolyticum TaxID=2508724 RepID=UPI0013E8E039|nr:nucleoside 2-deoxyribosyltransferase domain-containing protein [Halorubrum amylolyticum]